MKTIRSLPRFIFAPVVVATVAFLTWPATGGGADSPAPPASPATPVIGTADNASPDSPHPYFVPESVLTPAQRGQYRAAVEASRGRLQELDAQFQILQHELDEAVFAERLDERLVREKASAIAQIEGEKAVLRARALAAIRPSLTLEQLAFLKARNVSPRPKATPEQMEARRQEVKANLETRLAEEHEAQRQRLVAKLETEIAELRKKQEGAPLTTDEKDRLSRLQRMRDHIKAGGE